MEHAATPNGIKLFDWEIQSISLLLMNRYITQLFFSKFIQLVGRGVDNNQPSFRTQCFGNGTTEVPASGADVEYRLPRARLQEAVHHFNILQPGMRIER
jgi:hypothetical protein